MLRVCFILFLLCFTSFTLAEISHEDQMLLKSLEKRGMVELYIRQVQELGNNAKPIHHLKVQLFTLQQTPAQSDKEAVRIALKELDLYDRMIAEVSQQFSDFETLSDKLLAIKSNTPAPERSVAVQTMIDQENTEVLLWMLKSCEAVLLQIGPIQYQQCQFFIGSAQTKQIEQFNDHLNKVTTYLSVIDDVTKKCHAFMEWYPVNLWHQKFGETSFYENILSIEIQSKLLKGFYCYYQASLELMQNKSYDSLLPPLAQGIEAIDHTLKDSQTADQFFLELWKYRLQRMIDHSSDNHTASQTLLQKIFKLTNTAEQEWQIRYEALLFILNSNDKENNYIRAQIDKTQQWLSENRGALTYFSEKHLTLAMMKSQLDARQITDKNSPKALIKHIEPLKAILELHPELKPIIYEKIAQQLSEHLQNFDSNIHQTNWGIIECKALKQYFLSLEPPDLLNAIKTCELFFRQLRFHHPVEAEFWYDQAYCHYLLAEQRKEESDLEASETHLLKASHSWHHLAKTFPGWKHPNNPQAHSHMAAHMSTALAYQLYQSNPSKYQQTAVEIMSLLINTAPYANTPQAEQYRYYFAMVLKNTINVEMAIKIFNKVPVSDKNYHSACYQIALCWQKLLKQNLPSLKVETAIEELKRLTETLPKESHLNSTQISTILLIANIYMDLQKPQNCLDLIETYDAALKQLPPDDPAVLNAKLLKINAYQKLNQSDLAIAELNRTDSTQLKNKNNIALALNLLGQHKHNILRWHAQGNMQQLMSTLEQSLELNELIYAQLTDQDSKSNRLRTKQLLLEHITLWLISMDPTNNETTLLQKRQSQCSQLIEELKSNPNYSKQMWLIRCQALWHYSQKEYAESQKLWYHIRQATQNNQQKEIDYYWWEARFYGLLCLYHQQGSENVKQIITTIQKTHSGTQNAWLNRMETFAQQL